jgi:hypothetical protein
MGIRKNAKLLTAAEREDFVKACVLLKAEIVNPGAPVADRYSRWDELTALHRMIPGGYHLGLYVSGRYFPDGTAAPDGDHHHPGIARDPDGDGGEPFTRILTASLGAIDPTR